MIEADAVASAVVKLMADAAEWTGTAGMLRQRLGEIAGEAAAKARTWPGNDRALAGKLRRIAPFLRSPSVGIEAIPGRNHGGRYIHLRRSPTVGNFASLASLASQEQKNCGNPPVSGGSSRDAKRDANLAGDANGFGRDANGDANPPPDPVCVTDKPLETLAGDASDANDANSPTFPTPESTHTRRGVV